jgi:hypothetical protein
MTCTKTNTACTCTGDAAHLGPHACLCGQTWLGRGATNAAEHEVIMDAITTASAEGERIKEVVDEHAELCSVIRGVFGLNHAESHSVLKSYRLSLYDAARRSGLTVADYTKDMPDMVKGLMLGASVGGLLAVTGQATIIVEDSDNDE